MPASWGTRYRSEGTLSPQKDGSSVCSHGDSLTTEGPTPLAPSRTGSFPRNGSPLLLCQTLGASPAAPLIEQLGRLVLAVVREVHGHRARGDPGNADGIADHVSWAFWPLGPFGTRLVLGLGVEVAQGAEQLRDFASTHARERPMAIIKCFVGRYEPMSLAAEGGD